MTRALIVAALLVSAAGSRAEEWTAADTTFELVGAGLHLADWSQTLGIARNARLHRPGIESNPLLGELPSEPRVNLYFAGTLVMHAAVAYLLPQPYRRIWQVAWIGLEATSVGSNLTLGVRFALP